MLEKLKRTEQYFIEKKTSPHYKVFVGFDGYIDTIVRAVRSIDKEGKRDYFSTIDEFGKYIQSKAGKSCNIELVCEQKKTGGNAFLFADTIARLEMDTTCVGTFGYPQEDGLFQKNNPYLNLISILTPGNCMALEFSDGKVMLGDNTSINQLDYQVLAERLGEEKLLSLMDDADILAFMNWSEVLGSQDIWKGLLKNICPHMSKKKKRMLLLDLSDCSGRDPEDIQEMLMLIQEFSEYFDTVLSLNANEFQAVSGHKINRNAEEKALNAARKLYEMCDLKYLFLHLPDCAFGFDQEKEYFSETRCIRKPKLSTGGGDNFNAGLLYGLIHHMDVESVMITGNAASGYYITRGHGASQEQLLLYLDEWKKEILEVEV